MRILEVSLPNTPIYPERDTKHALGAIQLIIYFLAKGFRESGHECSIFTINPPSLIHDPYISIIRSFRANRSFDWYNFCEALIDFIQLSPLRYDIIHIHSFAYAINPRWKEIKIPIVFTWHDPPKILDGDSHNKITQIERVLSNCKNTGIHIVGISNFQVRNTSINTVIYNGIDLKLYNAQQSRSDRYLSIGRITPCKGQDIAVNSCVEANVKLDLAGPIHSEPFFSYFKSEIDGDQIKYHGNVFGEKKFQLFSSCKALLNPIRWTEPFGLTIIETLASGAPIVGFARGAVSEIAGHCGFFVKNEKELVDLLKRGIPSISPRKCLQRVQRFNYKRMCLEYLRLFEKL